MKNIRACLIFIFIYFMLNFCCTGNDENWPNLHFDFSIAWGTEMLIQWCVSERIKTQKSDFNFKECSK